MPTSMVLTWIEARMNRERSFANRALRTVFAPGYAEDAPENEKSLQPTFVHGT